MQLPVLLAAPVELEPGVDAVELEDPVELEGAGAHV